MDSELIPKPLKMEFDQRWPRKYMLILFSIRLLFALVIIPLIVAIDVVNDIFYSSGLLLTAKYANNPICKSFIR